MHIKFRLVAFLFITAVSGTSYGDNIQEFGTKSFAQLKQDFAGQGFVVSLWSIDCLPCRVELEMLSEIKQQDPEFPLLLISTDPIEKREDAVYILEEYDLDKIESWMFADAFVERLRFSIDPSWYGELPRSYFYDDAHTVKAHSGILSRDALNQLFPTAANL
jgi:thiol-disulfide isomerase/thioredoxin